MPSEGSMRSANPLKRPRQDPVSCQFCRSKKLKCDRQQPCSNCATRGLLCHGPTLSQSRATPLPEDANNASILARLKRLEDIVIGPSGQPARDVTGTLPTRTNSALACLSPASEYEEALHNLEETGTREENWIPSGTRDLEFQILSAQQMSNVPGVYQSLSAKLPHFQSPLKSVFLPPKDEASSLLDYYVKYVDELQHVVFMPQVRKLMDTLYANVDQGLLAPPSHVALILTILASSAALSSHHSGDCRLLFPPSVAVHASLVWANSALEVLEFSRRTTAGGLEDIQASILMAFLLYHVEGFSARSRRLFAGAISTARDLGMHRLDATSGPSADPKNSVDPVDVEIQRRVWWHVVATDWLLGLSGGPQEGTYLVQPNHFRVNLPRNIDDKALIYGRPLAEEPLSKPTTMSYYIQRIKLADICRSVVDVMPLSGVSTSVDYQQIIALDAKFQAFFDELPTFLKVDEKSRLETEEIMLHSPQLRIQRYALGMIARTRRCKLHQPFLIRRSVESHYTYSRDISISSARCVIRLKRQAEKELDSVNIVNVKLHGVVYHVFMATIVLVMDLCFNKNEGDDDDRKSEVAAACTILEEAARQSDLAREFLNSLMGIMRKHKVHLHHLSEEAADLPQPGQQGLPGSEIPDTAKATAPSESQLLHGFFPPQDNSQNYLSDFDAIWKDYVELGPNMDVPEWDNLFSDLDSRLPDTMRQAPDLSQDRSGRGS